MRVGLDGHATYHVAFLPALHSVPLLVGGVIFVSFVVVGGGGGGSATTVDASLVASSMSLSNILDSLSVIPLSAGTSRCREGTWDATGRSFSVVSEPRPFVAKPQSTSLSLFLQTAHSGAKQTDTNRPYKANWYQYANQYESQRTKYVRSWSTFAGVVVGKKRQSYVICLRVHCMQ